MNNEKKCSIQALEFKMMQWSISLFRYNTVVVGRGRSRFRVYGILVVSIAKSLFQKWLSWKLICTDRIISYSEQLLTELIPTEICASSLSFSGISPTTKKIETEPDRETEKENEKLLEFYDKKNMNESFSANTYQTDPNGIEMRYRI